MKIDTNIVPTAANEVPIPFPADEDRPANSPNEKPNKWDGSSFDEAVWGD